MKHQFTEEEKEVIKKHLELSKNKTLWKKHMDKVWDGDAQALWEDAVYRKFTMWRVEEHIKEDELNDKLYGRYSLLQAKLFLNRFMLKK